jgi:hypothetical protein
VTLDCAIATSSHYPGNVILSASRNAPSWGPNSRRLQPQAWLPFSGNCDIAFGHLPGSRVAQVERAGGGNYQSLINAALAEHIGRADETLEKTLRRVLREELRKAS